MKKVLIIFLTTLLAITNVFADAYNFHKLLKTKVTTDVLNIRELPTMNSKKVGKLYEGEEVYIAGFSDKRETIDGYNGYWVRIGLYNEKAYRDWEFSSKWVFSKYLDLDPKIEVSKMTAKNLVQKDGYARTLEIEIERNGKKEIIQVYPRKLDGQNFYTFRWNFDVYHFEDFSFTDPIGTFVYYPDTKKIKHITTLGDGEESAWNFFSDDFRYMFEDGGTSPGIRGLSVTDLLTNKIIFSGSYLNDIEYDGNSIIVVETDDSWSNCSEETVRRTEEFKKTKTPAELSWKRIIVRYRMNLKTLEKSFVDCVLLTEQ